MALQQLQYGAGRQQIGQNTPDAHGQMKQGMKDMDEAQKMKAEQITLDTLHGTAPQQGLLGRVKGAIFGQEPRSQDEFKKPYMWNEIGSVSKGQAPKDMGFNPDIFTRFGKKFDMEGMRGNMLAQTEGIGGGGVRRHLTKMLHDKLPDAIMKQQKIDSMNMLEEMAKSAQKKWGMDEWEDKLSEKIKNSPEAKQWWANYITLFEDDMESMPDIMKKIRAKQGKTTKGTTETQVILNENKEILRKRVGRLETMVGPNSDKTDKAMKQLDSFIKKAKKDGYEFRMESDGEFILSAPWQSDLVLTYDPYIRQWNADPYGAHNITEGFRYFGIDPWDVGSRYR